MKLQNNKLSHLFTIALLFFFIIPVFIFLAFYVRVYYATPLIIGVSYFLFLEIKQQGVKVKDYFVFLKDDMFWAAIAVGTIILLPSDIGNLASDVHDFNGHNPFHQDMLLFDWPLWYSKSEVQDLGITEDVPYIYYLGSYLPSSLISKLIVGITESNVLLIGNICYFIYTYFSFGLFLYLCFLTYQPSSKKRVLLLIIFSFFIAFFNTGDIFAAKVLFGNIPDYNLWCWKYFGVEIFSVNLLTSFYIGSHYVLPLFTVLLFLINRIQSEENTRPFHLILSVATLPLFNPLGCVSIIPFIILLGIIEIKRNQVLFYVKLPLLWLSFVVFLILCSYVLSNRMEATIEFFLISKSPIVLLKGFGAFIFFNFFLVLLPLLIEKSKLVNQANKYILVAAFLGFIISITFRFGYWNDFTHKNLQGIHFVLCYLLFQFIFLSKNSFLFKSLYVIIFYFIIFTTSHMWRYGILDINLTKFSEVKRRKVEDLVPKFTTSQRMGNPNSFFFKYLSFKPKEINHKLSTK